MQITHPVNLQQMSINDIVKRFSVFSHEEHAQTIPSDGFGSIDE